MTYYRGNGQKLSWRVPHRPPGGQGNLNKSNRWLSKWEEHHRSLSELLNLTLILTGDDRGISTYILYMHGTTAIKSRQRFGLHVTSTCWKWNMFHAPLKRGQQISLGGFNPDPSKTCICVFCLASETSLQTHQVSQEVKLNIHQKLLLLEAGFAS